MTQIQKAVGLLLIILPPFFTIQAQQILMPWRKGSLWGYADTTGKIVVKPRFDRAGLFPDGFNYASVEKMIDGKRCLGLVKNTGALIIPPLTYYNIEVAAGNFNLYNDTAYLPHRLRNNRYKKEDYRWPHWTDSLPLLFIAEKRAGRGGAYSLYLFDSTGKQLTFNPAGEISVFCYQPLQYHFRVKINNKSGVVTQNGKMVIPAGYERLECVHEQNGRYVIIARKNGKSGLIDMNNKVLLPLVYDEIRRERYGNDAEYLLIARKKGSSAVLHPNGTFIENFKPGTVRIEAERGSKESYRIIRNGDDVAVNEVPNTETEAPWVKKNQHAEKYIDETKAIAKTAPAAVTTIYSVNGLFGLKHGDSILAPAKYNSLTTCNCGRSGAFYIAGMNGLYGLITRENQAAIPVTYKQLEAFFYYRETENVLFLAQKENGKYGVVDLNNRPLIPFEYNNISRSSEAGVGLAAVFACSNNSGTVIYDHWGRILSKSQYISAKPLLSTVARLDDQLWIVNDKNGNTGLMSNTGATIVNTGIFSCFNVYYGRTGYYSRTFIRVTSGGNKQGILSHTGDVILPAEFDTVYNFVVPAIKSPQYNPAKDSVFHFAVVKNGLSGIIDMYGRIKLPLAWTKFSWPWHGTPYLVVEKDSMTGIATFDNPNLVTPQKNLVFPVAENGPTLLGKGFLFYRNGPQRENNMGLFIIKNNQVLKQLPAIYARRLGGPTSSLHRQYFSFIALERENGESSYYDYVGENGVQFFEE